jgi:PAS domain S-box-containing protein
MQSDFEQDTRSMAVEPPASPALSTATSALMDQEMNTSKVTTRWEDLFRWLQAVFFAPGMLPAPWSHPVIGYLFAFLGQVTTAAVLVLVPHTLSLFRFPSALMLLVVLLAALGWGVGPSLVATLMGTILLLSLLFPPALSANAITVGEATAVFPYVLLGLTISLLISQIQREHMAAQKLSQRLKSINEALCVSEERYRTIVETAYEGIWLMDTKSHTLYTNERMAQLLDRKPVELEGHTLLEFVFAEDEIAARARIANNLRGYTEQFEFRFRRSDGSVLETLASTSPIRDTTGAIVGVLGLFTDLTARKQIEEELQHSETLLHMAIKNSPIAIFQQDRNLRYTWMANPPSFTPEAIIGKGDADFVSPEEATHLTKIKQHVLSSGEGVCEEIHIGSEDKGRWELLTLEPLRDRQGNIVGISGTSINITEQKRMAQEHLAQERLEAQANELAAREAANLMEEFLGIVGHELRTPLTTIKASVQLARRNLNRIKQREETLPSDVVPLLTTVRGLLERTERQVGMQNRLVSDLLDVSRIQTGRLELHLKVHMIGKVVRQVVEDQQSLTPERTIRIEVPSQDTLQVLADEDRLRQVITNYLSNALKYSETEKPVEIRVELEANGTQVRVTVKDEGPGLSEQQQQRIWERFYRVPEIEVKSGSGVGLGLGLPISCMLIERQGGEVGVQSKPGQGSAFWFTLPIAKVEGE